MKVENKSGLHPKGWAVLIKPYAEELRKGSIILPRKETVLENRGTVIEVGADAWSKEKEPRAVVGDVVLITQFAGFMALGADGEQYRLVNCADIFCVVEVDLFKENTSGNA